ncbi:MAG: hypothetical protein ABIR62_16665, partial [Dokdonella sp.]|uniref:hypothetical protein n=1 Tax=Dokdonella sp. TaxID=2291710 RepID=UPI0032661CFD
MKIEKRLRRVVNGLAAASVLWFAPFAMANNAYRADAGSGAHADQIYWMDWSGYSSVADGTTAFSFNLADGSVLSLDLTRTGSGTRKFEGVCSPTYNGSAMGNVGYTWSTYPGTCAGNVSVNGRPNVVLYPTDGSIGNNVSFKLSNINLVNPRGDAVDEFEIILVDGESMDTGDGAGGKITFISTGDSWNQLERLPATGRNGPAILPGIGTGTVVEAAQSAPVAAWLVTTAKPATGTFDVTASITSTAKQGIMLGIRWGAVRLTKNIVSRGDPSDQFTYRILNNATPPLSIGRGACTAALPGAIGDCTTSGTTTGAQDTLSASILPGNIVTLAEDMAPGSASSLAQYKKTIQCTNSNAGSTTVLPGNGAAIAYDPANPPTLDVRNADDLVDCVITNAVEADVAVTKTGPATVAPGATINYELIVSNNGPGNASGTLFSDAVPTAITAVAASCGAVTGGAVCNNADITVAGNAVSGFIATLPTGATAKILITGTAPATVQAVLNAAHVDPPVGTTDPDEDNNDSSTVTTNVVDADMQATITLPPTANAGDPVHGTFTCTNNGPGVAANATCTVAGLPAGAVVFCTPAPPVATLPVGGVINCTVDFTAPLTGPISGTATAGSDTPDPNPANNTAVATLAITPLANLAITKVASPAGTYLPGQSLNYSITVVNNGPSGVSGASVLDTVPANVAVSAWSCVATGAGADCDTTQAGSGATGTTNTIALTQVALPSGTSLLISVTGTVDLAATGTITNTASVTPPTGTTCSTPPCVRGSTVTNSNGGAPQLSIQKSATPAAFAVGQTGTYSVLVGNSGTSATTGTITVTDPLPPGITTTATPSGTGWNCSASTPTNVVCSTNAVLSPGANAPIISVPVAIAAGTTSPARNVAGTSGGGDSGCPAAPRCSSAIETPVDAPLIDVEKTLQGTLIVGVEASYVITATNNGQAPTLVGTLVDTIPAGLSIGTLPTGCSAAGQVITCALPAGIAVGGSISYTIPVTPQASADGQNVSNTATG